MGRLTAQQAEPLNMKQAGLLLGVAGPTIRRMIERGGLEANRTDTGGRGRVAYEITQEAIDDYLDRCRVKPGELTKLWDQSGDLQFI